MLEPAAVASNADEPMQFERQGYFRRDRDSAPGKPVFVRTVGLRDTFAKTLGGGLSTARPAVALSRRISANLASGCVIAGGAGGRRGAPLDPRKGCGARFRALGAAVAAAPRAGAARDLGAALRNTLRGRARRARRASIGWPSPSALGALVYFMLPREPLLVALLGGALVFGDRGRRRLSARHLLAARRPSSPSSSPARRRRSSASTASSRRRSSSRPVVATSAAAWSTARAAPSFARASCSIEIRSERHPAGAMPERIRVTLAERYGLPPLGSRVTLNARLMPVSGPVVPGGYDPHRAAFFDGIGGSGFVLGSWTLEEEPPRFSLDLAVARIRAAIVERIMAARAGRGGRGRRRAARRRTERALGRRPTTSLRISGLYHILSISGLHMMLIAGTTFFVVRALLRAVAARWRSGGRSANGRRSPRSSCSPPISRCPAAARRRVRSYVMALIMFARDPRRPAGDLDAQPRHRRLHRARARAGRHRRAGLPDVVRRGRRADRGVGVLARPSGRAARPTTTSSRASGFCGSSAAAVARRRRDHARRRPRDGAVRRLPLRARGDLFAARQSARRAARLGDHHAVRPAVARGHAVRPGSAAACASWPGASRCCSASPDFVAALPGAEVQRAADRAGEPAPHRLRACCGFASGALRWRLLGLPAIGLGLVLDPVARRSARHPGRAGRHGGRGARSGGVLRVSGARAGSYIVEQFFDEEGGPPADATALREGVRCDALGVPA